MTYKVVVSSDAEQDLDRFWIILLTRRKADRLLSVFSMILLKQNKHTDKGISLAADADAPRKV